MDKQATVVLPKREAQTKSYTFTVRARRAYDPVNQREQIKRVIFKSFRPIVRTMNSVQDIYLCSLHFRLS